LKLAGFCAAAFLLLGASCRAGANGSPAATPAPVSGPRAVLPSGSVYQLEIAVTPEEKARGLMFRESLREKTGMLFPFSDGQPHSFWMKNTMIPLDIIWMDETGRVFFVSANTPPCTADPCGSYGPATPVSHVLELAGGMAAKEKVTPGSRIRLLDIPPPPPSASPSAPVP
jgi:uncharacterized membrane protein (UPF0127 family)